jgi:hypothetical protein
VVCSTWSNVNDGEARQFEKLILEFQDLFATIIDSYGWTDRVYHLIDTGHSCPIHRLCPTLPLAKQAEVDKTLKDMR